MKAAVTLAIDSRTGELTRITAFQVGGRMGAEELQPILFQTALNGETMALRISAVGTLGVLGDSSAKSLLTNIINGQEERLKIPAQYALAQIERLEKQKQATDKTKI